MNKKNIIIVSQYYYPEPFQKLKDIAEYLNSRDYNVIVLCGVPNYPNGKLYNGYDNTKKEETINGVKIIRVPIILRGVSLISLALNYLSFALVASGFIMLGRFKADIILCYQTSPITMLIPAVFLSRRNNIPLICYCLDLWPESILASFKNKKNALYYVVNVLVKYLYSNCTKILVSSPYFKKYIHDTNDVRGVPISYLPQHGNDRYLANDFSKHGGGVFKFLFAGNMGIAQDIGVILEATEILYKEGIKNFVMIFIGSGSMKSFAESWVNEHGLGSIVKFEGRKRYEDLVDYYRDANALILTLRHINDVGNTIPGKFQDYLAIGKPIIAAIDGPVYEMINNNNCGKAVHSGDAVNLSRIMKDIVIKSDKYLLCGENARDLYKKYFSSSIIMRKLEKEISEAV